LTFYSLPKFFPLTPLPHLHLPVPPQPPSFLPLPSFSTKSSSMKLVGSLALAHYCCNSSPHKIKVWCSFYCNKLQLPTCMVIVKLGVGQVFDFC
jgi:hypothetical protein